MVASTATRSPCLVADVGGTNTRLAIWDGQALSQRVRIANDDHPRFIDVLHAYGQAGAVGSCYIAIAGPVTGGRAELTNRDWHFERTEIAQALDLSGENKVRLINDLVAQGHAIDALSGDQLIDLRAKPGAPAGNGQALVVNMGTGFNVCLVRSGPEGPVVCEAELGHASLPQRVASVLRDVLGEKAGAISTNEDVFSGRGLSRLYGLMTGWGDRPGEAILSDYGNGGASAETRTVDLSARLMGILARELVYYYLPMGGIYFAGSAARAVLTTAAKGEFLQAFTRPGRFIEQVEQVPVRMIADDGAALLGVARFAASQRPTA